MTPYTEIIKGKTIEAARHVGEELIIRFTDGTSLKLTANHVKGDIYFDPMTTLIGQML